jgi:hypothetical protein
LEGIPGEAHKMNQILLSVLIKNNAYIPSRREGYSCGQEYYIAMSFFTAAWLLRYVVISGSVVYIYTVSVLWYIGNESVRKCTAFEVLRKASIK